MSSSRRPLKVVQLIPEDSLGGAETAGREMSCRKDLGCDFQLIALAGKVLKPGKGRLNSLEYGSPLSPIAQLAAVKAVRSLKPDVLICSLWKCVPAAIIAKLLLPQTKLVAFFHSARRVHFFDRLGHWLLLHFADAVWADSDATLEAVRKSDPHKPSRVISFVIDRTPGEPNARQPLPRFISWARIHDDKGVDRAIDLIALLVARGIDAEFDLWGPDQGPVKALQNQANRLGIGQRIRFHGSFARSELPSIASEAGFLLQLSRQEGMAMVVVEAMQLGLVPIVTPVGEIGRYCRNGENSVIVDAADLEIAADQIAVLLKDPDRYAAMSKAARSKWSSCRLYSDDVCAAAQELAGQA